MKDDRKARVESFLASLTLLFHDLDLWAKDAGLSVKESEISITEPQTGKYTAKKLTVSDNDGTALAEVRPIGAWIIGADWRVDIVGHLDTQTIVYWSTGSPEIHPPEDDRTYVSRKRLFGGTDQPGWYWIENKMLGRARPLNKDLFIDLIRVVQPL